MELKIRANVEGDFNDTRNALLDRRNVLQNELSPTKEQWAGTAKFIAAQVLRTPRFFQTTRDHLDAEKLPYENDTPQRVMLILIDRWIIRLVRMRGLLVYTETELPLLTSDNPAVMWKKKGTGFYLWCRSIRP